MEKIDIQNFKKYYQNNDGNGTVARVGHVNAVIDNFTEAITRDYVAELGTFAASSLNKVENYNFSFQGDDYDVYNFQARTQLSGSNTYVYPIGSITTSSPDLGTVNSKSIIAANDSVLDQVVTPLGVSALVRDSSTGAVIPVTFMAINIDNNITTPDEYFIYLLGLDGVNFECTVVIDIEVAVVKGSTVEYTVI